MEKINEVNVKIQSETKTRDTLHSEYQMLRSKQDLMDKVKITGMGIIRKKSKAKAKAKAKGHAINMPIIQQPINQPMLNTGFQPQLYRPQPTITPQIPQPVVQPTIQPTVQSTVQPTIGAGKFKKPRAKANSKKLKPIKEDEEIVEVIKPPKMSLDFYDALNDAYLINRIR